MPTTVHKENLAKSRITKIYSSKICQKSRTAKHFPQKSKFLTFFIMTVFLMTLFSILRIDGIASSTHFSWFPQSESLLSIQEFYLP